MTERKFKVLKGGASVSISKSNHKFVSAFVTDTRLMGVVGLYIHWELNSAEYATDFHQFYYFDAEEYGFETYKSLMGNDTDELAAIEQALIGGLGGNKVEVTEKEAIYLIQKYAEMNQRLSLPMPDNKSEYSFLLKEKLALSDDELAVLVDKLCTPIESDYQLINYFLMRVFGRDFEAASYLLKGDIPLEEHAEGECATLCKNSIEEYSDENGFSYLCESLIEINDKYKLVMSEITVHNGKICSLKKRSSFYITSAEAAMLLNRPEFITVYEIITDTEDFMIPFSEISARSMQTVHESGRLYMEFNINNDHVNRKIYRLNEDIHGLYYVTDYGQLIVAAYNLPDIQSIEKKLRNSEVNDYIIATAKYEFKEPILYEFIQSEFDDFTDFLDYLNSFN